MKMNKRSRLASEATMQCDWRQIGEREYVCSRCGGRLYVPEGYPNPPDFSKTLPCRGGSAPQGVRIALRYSAAVKRWVAAGRPVRSDDRVREIFENYCKPCEHFDSERQTCRVCGCRVRRSGAALLNKLKMATERCPLDPPKWTEEA